MKCEEFEAHLNDILDERRRPEWDEQLRLHSQQCRGCRELAAAYSALFEGFFALPAIEAPVDLPARVLEELQVRPVRMPRLVAAVAAVFSTAAAILVAVSMMRDNHPQPQVAVAPSPQPAIAARWKKLDDVPLFGPLIMTMNELDDAEPYEEVAKETGQGLATLVLRMPGVAGPRGVRPPAPATMKGPGLLPLQLSEELRPVRESVAETFDLLLGVLPIRFSSNENVRSS